MFGQRASRRPDGELYVYEPVPDPDTLGRAGARVVSTRDPQSLSGGVFWLSGEVPRRTPYEVGLPGHLRRSADGRSWDPDPLIMDERFVSVHVKDKGQVVFSACSHAGVINVLTHARAMFPAIALHGVMGGLHLSGVTERIIPETVADLKGLGLALVAAGHCTGWRALTAMAQALGEAIVPTAVGKRYVV
jgi:7,8-dihydropterin-6-yl-methyl-4-(beta-D-ribofuranosyl)aminobenzene 5'-phosphate synthase